MDDLKLKNNLFSWIGIHLDDCQWPPTWSCSGKHVGSSLIIYVFSFHAQRSRFIVIWWPWAQSQVIIFIVAISSLFDKDWSTLWTAEGLEEGRKSYHTARSPCSWTCVRAWCFNWFWPSSAHEGGYYRQSWQIWIKIWVRVDTTELQNCLLWNILSWFFWGLKSKAS